MDPLRILPAKGHCIMIYNKIMHLKIVKENVFASNDRALKEMKQKTNETKRIMQVHH